MISHQEGWEFHPAGGTTGNAFMGVRNQERVFFKRNVSPLIAALATEGFVPRLKWTKRTYSGDILTAQEWKDGRTLSHAEMTHDNVIDILVRVHHSDTLLMRLKRTDQGYKRPVDFIDEYFDGLHSHLRGNSLLNEVVQSLEDSLDDDFYRVEYRVCHGDINHNNFLLSENQLYLVDWESVAIADPISDLTQLLIQYIEVPQWEAWLHDYGITQITPSIYKRIHWYTMMNLLFLIKHYYGESQIYSMNEMVERLKLIYSTYKKNGV